MLVELRQYQIAPGGMDPFVTIFESQIIPFQTAKGITFLGSYVSQDDPNVFVWLRAFRDEAHRQQLYQSIYEDPTWLNQIKPQFAPFFIDKHCALLAPTPLTQTLQPR